MNNDEKIVKILESLQATQEQQGKALEALQGDVTAIKGVQQEQGRDICIIQATQQSQGRAIAIIQAVQQEQGKQLEALNQRAERIEKTQVRDGEEMGEMLNEIIARVGKINDHENRITRLENNQYA